MLIVLLSGPVLKQHLLIDNTRQNDISECGTGQYFTE